MSKGKKQIDTLGQYKLLNKWREKTFHNKKDSETCITVLVFLLILTTKRANLMRTQKAA
jgi:hypothetical protein